MLFLFSCALFYNSHINFTTLNVMIETCLLQKFMPLYNRNVLSYKWKWCCLICINKIIIWIYSHRIICKMSAICLVVLLPWGWRETSKKAKKDLHSNTHWHWEPDWAWNMRVIIQCKKEKKYYKFISWLVTCQHLRQHSKQSL